MTPCFFKIKIMKQLTNDEKFVFLRLFKSEVFHKEGVEADVLRYFKRLKHYDYEVRVRPAKGVKMYDRMPLQDIVESVGRFDIVEHLPNSKPRL